MPIIKFGNKTKLSVMKIISIGQDYVTGNSSVMWPMEFSTLGKR